MNRPLLFVLNDEITSTSLHPATTLLDFLRYEKDLKGTKVGCREGDCGACTVLMGVLQNDSISYKTITSCLTPLGNIVGKHIITIEGINPPDQTLSLVQEAMIDQGGTQCGFCTPGFIVSLTEFAINSDLSFHAGLESISGNICRCTGYKPIERAINIISSSLKEKKLFKEERNQLLVEEKVIPEYFLTIGNKLRDIKDRLSSPDTLKEIKVSFIGGGTDLYVQKPDALQESKNIYLWDDHLRNNGITFVDKQITVRSGTTFTEILESNIFQKFFPNLRDYIKLIASTPIRNLATVAGNIINASPIGDFTIFFLALDSVLVLRKDKFEREVLLKNFYLDYKKIDLEPNEFLYNVRFQVPQENSRFNFEKVSKRTHLDIASVNSAISINVDQNNRITKIGISAGGLAPIPKFLNRTTEYMMGKELNSDLLREAHSIAQTEVKPISDARGSKEYKRLLFRQLFYTHFIKLFSEKIHLEDLIQ